MKLLLRLSDIPVNSKVALFGAGLAGENVLNILRAFRPDIEPLYFIDSFKTGRLGDLSIIDPLSFFEQETNEILVLIASVKWREIESLFIDKLFKGYLIIPPHFFVPSAYQGLLNSRMDDPCEDSMSHVLFSTRDLETLKDRLTEVQELLDYSEDRLLFRLLTGDYTPYGTYAENVSHYYYNSRLKRQYFDFIDYSRIRTIIEGGVADGGDTLEFLKQPGVSRVIHGFEPNKTDYIESPNKKILDKNSNVKINFKGLWSRSGALFFNRCGLSSGIISQSGGGVDSLNNPGVSTIDVISIDEYVAEENIQNVDFIKLDVEGAELEVLKGAVNTLKRCRPQLAICLYHKKEHFYEIPFFLKSHLYNYRYRLGHYTARSFETVWYAIPNELTQDEKTSF